MPEWMNTDMMLMWLVRLMVIFLIFPLHEFAHAFTAHLLGDNTAKYQGRMTIDPITHLEPFGALFLMIFGFGWAKPVPVNPANFKHKNFDMMLVAVAGPLMNLLLAQIGMAAMQMCGCFSHGANAEYWYAVTDGTTESYLAWMLYNFVDVNLLLCIFNLLPIPPLDGSRVLIYFLPPKASVWFMRHSRIFYGIMLFLLVTGILSLPMLAGKRAIARGMVQLVQLLPVVM